MKQIFIITSIVFGTTAMVSAQPASDSLKREFRPLIQAFLNARCAQSVTWRQSVIPGKWSRFSLRDVYAPGLSYPFIILYAHRQDDSPQLLFKGFCRGHNIAFVPNHPGWYFIAVLDQQKPSLLCFRLLPLEESEITLIAACALSLTDLK